MTKDSKLITEAYAASMVDRQVQPGISANNTERQMSNIPRGAAAPVNWGSENNEDDAKKKIVSMLSRMQSDAKAGTRQHYDRIFFDIKQLQQLLNQVIN